MSKLVFIFILSDVCILSGVLVGLALSNIKAGICKHKHLGGSLHLSKQLPC